MIQSTAVSKSAQKAQQYRVTMTYRLECRCQVIVTAGSQEDAEEQAQALIDRGVVSIESYERSLAAMRVGVEFTEVDQDAQVEHSEEV